MSKNKKWLLYISIAFAPILTILSLTKFGFQTPEWVLIPVALIAATFISFAYYERMS